MKRILGISILAFLALGLSGCSGEPNVREVESAMRVEFKEVFPDTVDVNEIVVLQKIRSCKKDKAHEGAFVCIVEVDEKMAPSPDGKTPGLREVAVRKEGDKWVTVKGILPPDEEPATQSK